MDMIVELRKSLLKEIDRQAACPELPPVGWQPRKLHRVGLPELHHALTLTEWNHGKVESIWEDGVLRTCSFNHLLELLRNFVAEFEILPLPPGGWPGTTTVNKIRKLAQETEGPRLPERDLQYMRCQRLKTGISGTELAAGHSDGAPPTETPAPTAPSKADRAGSPARGA